MKARDVIGKTIVAVEHTRWYNEHLHRMEADCVALILDDGSRLVPNAYETLETPAATILYVNGKGENG